MATKDFACSKEQSVADFSGSNRGNGNDDHAPIGLWSGTVFRELLQFDHDWTGVYQITKAELVLTRTGGVHVGIGGAPKIVGRRNTEGWSRDGGSENSWSAAAATHYGNQPASTSTGAASLLLPATSAGGTTKLDVTDIIEALAPATVLRRDGTPGGGATNTNRGIKLLSDDEGTNNRTCEFYSMRAPAGKRPFIRLTYSTNHPPSAPTITSPVGSTTPEPIGSTGGTTDTTTFVFMDEDVEDYPAQVETEYYSSGATDDATGAFLWSQISIPVATGSLNAYRVTISSLPARTGMRKRLRTKDDKGAWGAWTSLANGYVMTAYKPSAPAAPFMQTTADRPHIFGTIASPDTSDYVTGWEGEFYRDDTTGTVTLWAPGKVEIGASPTRSDVEYSGTTLNPGDVVRWRHRHYNRDGVAGDWSPFYTTTILAQTGPTTMTPSDTGTKLLSRTAQLTIGNSSNFDGYQWRLYRSGVLLYDSGLTAVASTASTNVTLPTSGGSPLAQWGDELEWEAAIRPTGGSLESFSPRRPIRVDALPSTLLSVSV